jgi:integrase
VSRRPRGVFRDPSGTWGYIFTSSHRRADGKRRQVRRRGFATMGEAKDALDQARREDTPGTAGTVGAVLDQFVRAKRLAGRAPATLAQYQWAADLVAGRWGGWPAEQLTAEHLDAAYLEMLTAGKRVHRRGKGSEATDRPMSARSVEVVHKTVKAAFQLAVDKGQLVRNPAALATPPAVVEQRHTWWTPEQVGRFLAYAAEHSDLPAGLVDVLADTGGRRGEVLGLRWSDLDVDACTATITRQLVEHPDDRGLAYRATKRPRSKATVGLHPGTVATLRRRRVERGEHRLKMGAGWPGADTVHADLVFTWPDGTAIRPATLTRIIARLSVEAGLPRLTPHGLRHSFATAALRARVPVEVVAARLGNTPRVVQEVYSHVIPADDQAAAQLVGDLYRRDVTNL